MNTPEPSDDSRLVEELTRTPPGGWVAVVRRHAAAPARVVAVLETAALLAAEKARAATGVEPAAWLAVLDQLAAEYPAHAAEVRECAGMRTALAGGRRPAPAADHRLHTGDRLGPFVVTGFVSAGGMGEVYEAAQDGLKRRVALKVIRAGTAGELARARFDRERLVLARLHQSNIVPVYFAGADGDLQYYAMQYVPGAPLNRVVSAVFQRASTAPKTAQTPPLSEVVGSLLKAPPAPPPPSDATQVATHSGPSSRFAGPEAGAVRLSAGYFRSVAAALAQVAEAIQHGHDTGFLHRDIKPSNLILDARGVCMVIDYGLARACGAAPPDAPDDTATEPLTRGGVGTPQYMAPEQFAGHADERSDVWGLGATLYELLTLRPAFAPGPWSDLEQRVRHEKPPPAAAVVPTVPKDLAAIGAKALAKAAADRYQTAGEFAADLRRWLRWEPTAARPGWGTLRPLRLWACRHVGAAAAALLAVAALVAWGAAWSASASAAQERADRRADHEKQGRELADARAAQADERAEEAKRSRDFAAALAEAEELRRRRPYAGWAEDLRRKLDAARRVSPDASLKDAYTATLVGPDAHRVRTYVPPGKRFEKAAGFSSVAFGPDGRIVCGGYGTTPGMVFDPHPARDPIPTTLAAPGPVAFPAADTPLQLLGPSNKDTFLLWNLAANQAVAEFALPKLPGRLTGFASALSADGRRVAVSVSREPDAAGVRPGVTVVWEVATKAQKSWDRPASALAFSPDGKYLAVGSEAGGVAVSDAATGEEVLTLRGERSPVKSLAFGRAFKIDATGTAPPAGGVPGLLLAAGYDGSAVVWDLGIKERVSVCRGASHYVLALAFTPDGATLITAGHDVPTVWDVATGRAVFNLGSLNADDKVIHRPGIAVSPDGRRVAVAGTNALSPRGSLQVYEFDADRGVSVYRGQSGRCGQTWVSPSGGLVVSLAHGWELAVWDRATGAVRRVWDVPVGITADNADVAFDEPAGAVYFASGETACKLNLATGARDQVWRLPRGLNDSFAVRPGQPPVLVRRENVIRARELLADGTSREKYRIAADFAPVQRMDLHAGGKYLLVHVSGEFGRGNPSRVYDAETGRHLPLPAALAANLISLGRVATDGSRLFVLTQSPGEATKMEQYRLPDFTHVRTDGNASTIVVDDAGTLTANSNLPGDRYGIHVLRVGSREPVVSFDTGGPPAVGPYLTPDGRFAHWSREDGSACVADLVRALERLAVLTGR